MKLDEIGPSGKEREVEALQMLQQAKTPAPPGPKLEETEPSVQTQSSEGGRSERKSSAMAFLSGKGSCFEHPGMEGLTEKEGKFQGGKGGQSLKGSRFEPGSDWCIRMGETERPPGGGLESRLDS